MVTGHFGLGAGVKSREWFVPLWALMLATVWLDVIFIPLLATGAETIDDVPGTDGGYGDVIIHADYTHSLVGAAVIAVATGWIATRWWARRDRRDRLLALAGANLVAGLILLSGASVLASDVLLG